MNTGKYKTVAALLLRCLIALLSLGATVAVMLSLLFVRVPGNGASSAAALPWDGSMDRYLAPILAEAEAGARELPKRFWIPEGAPIPARDDSKYGTAGSASELGWLLDSAADLLDGQEMLFSTDTPIRAGTEITWYLDETILAITWQQVIDRMVYTIGEVKIADPSQFRRYLADGYYGSGNHYTTAQMSAQAGAVLASSGDHFFAKTYGIVVYDGEVRMFDSPHIQDSCFIDDKGDLIMTPRRTFTTQQEVEQFVADNRISFSLAFGPMLIRDGETVENTHYGMGEIFQGYPRTALCQKDSLHYLVVTANGVGANTRYPTIKMFTQVLETFDLQQAYALDGGRTGAIVMRDRMLNPLEYEDGQRRTGDMLMFVTALPNHKK